MYITGNYNSSSLTFGTITLTGANNYFIVKYNTAGSALWGINLGTNCAASSIAFDERNNVYVTGSFYDSTAVFGSYTLINSSTNLSNGDMFIAKIDSTQITVGSKEIIKDENGISIYPNPFTSTTTITFSEEQKNTSLKITDVIGQTILQSTITNQQYTIDMSSFAKGIYFVSIQDENKNIINRKIIKQ